MLDYPVPPPGPPGPFGTMAWLRATVSRFAEGETHARRRAMVEARLAALDPAALRAAARAAAEDAPQRASARGGAWAAAASPRVRAGGGAGRGDRRRRRRRGRRARPSPPRTSPATDAPGADEALQRLLDRLPPGDEEALAQHVALLVQACEATAALIRGDDPPVPSTKRLDPDGNVIVIDLAGRPFGEGRRACPGREHALALARTEFDDVR